MDQVVSARGPLQGQRTVPGDKSVSHRALILAAMADGRSRIARCALGGDVDATRDALTKLGVSIEADDQLVRVDSKGWSAVARAGTLDARNSGTTMRLLAGALSGIDGTWTIEGDESLTNRPMDRVAKPLRMMGAEFEMRDGKFPPLVMRGGELRGIHYDLPVASAQVKGAVLLAGIQADGATLLTEALPSRDHTERILSWLGADIVANLGEVELAGRFDVPAFDLDIPGDFSSAAYPLVAACLVPGSEIEVVGVGVNQSRTGLLDILRSMGATFSYAEEAADPEPIGIVSIRHSELVATEVGGDLVPRSIDELLLVAVAATSAHGTTMIRDAAELRVKETDRIATLVSALSAMGAEIEATEDGMRITGPRQLTGTTVESAGDHRIALSLAVAGLIAEGPTTIRGWESTRISYPGFLEDLEKLLHG